MVSERIKVLWISNIPPITLPEHPQSIGGGWLAGAYENISKDERIELVLAFPVSWKLHGLKGEFEGSKYYGFSSHKMSIGVRKYGTSRFSMEKDIGAIIRETKPDILHIFGTEFKHSRIAVECFEQPHKTIIHIQGLVSVYAKHCRIGLPFFLRHMIVPESMLRGTLARKSQQWEKAGIDEVAAIKQVQYVMGRTEWDAACIRAINPSITYLHCGETLRTSFYKVQWKQDQCVRHSIYFSQSFSQVKGLHQVLPILSQLIVKYPDMHLYVGGNSPIGGTDFQSLLKRSPLGWYFKYQIKKYQLHHNVTFLGSQTEEQVAQNLLKANVFLSASLIENSPNSVGEAMVVGTPVVSSDVGGVKDFLRHGENGYIYPVDEPYMIPFYISKIFDNSDLADSFSNNSRESSKKVYSPSENGKKLLAIYRQIGLEK